MIRYPFALPLIGGRIVTPEDVLRLFSDDRIVRQIASDYIEEQGHPERAALLRLERTSLSLEQALLWINEGRVE